MPITGDHRCVTGSPNPTAAPAKRGFARIAKIGCLSIIGFFLLIIVIVVITDSGGNSAAPTPGTLAPVVSAAAQAPATHSAPAPAPAPSGPMTVFKDGDYNVGSDIAPGNYWTDGKSDMGIGCYWQKAKDNSGEFDSIITNDNLTEGARGQVSLAAGQWFKTQGGCQWQKR